MHDRNASTEPGPFEGPPTLDRLALEMRQHRKDFREFKTEVSERWRMLDKEERRLDRFFSEWYGSEEGDNPGLSRKVREMIEEWSRIRWGGRVLVGVLTTAASAVGYFIARFLESHTR